MPRYFMNYREQGELIIDEAGKEFPNLEAARKEAEDAALEILAEKVRYRDLINGDAIEIVNEANEMLAAIPLRKLVKLD